MVLSAARSRRVVAVVGIVVAATIGITACDKPIPKVTLQSGSTSTALSASCFGKTASDCTNVSPSGSIAAKSGGTLLIDVPREVAGDWQAQSVTRDEDGKFSQIQGTGVSVQQDDSHSARLNVPVGTGSYYVIVQGKNEDGVGFWVAEVKVND